MQSDYRVYGMKEDRLGGVLADEFRSAKSVLGTWKKGNGDFAAEAKDVCSTQLPNVAPHRCHNMAKTLL